MSDTYAAETIFAEAAASADRVSRSQRRSAIKSQVAQWMQNAGYQAQFGRFIQDSPDPSAGQHFPPPDYEVAMRTALNDEWRATAQRRYRANDISGAQDALGRVQEGREPLGRISDTRLYVVDWQIADGDLDAATRLIFDSPWKFPGSRAYAAIKLARAHEAQGNRTDALATLERARSDMLAANYLHPSIIAQEFVAMGIHEAATTTYRQMTGAAVQLARSKSDRSSMSYAISQAVQQARWGDIDGASQYLAALARMEPANYHSPSVTLAISPNSEDTHLPATQRRHTVQERTTVELTVAAERWLEIMPDLVRGLALVNAETAAFELVARAPDTGSRAAGLGAIVLAQAERGNYWRALDTLRKIDPSEEGSVRKRQAIFSSILSAANNVCFHAATIGNIAVIDEAIEHVSAAVGPEKALEMREDSSLISRLGYHGFFSAAVDRARSVRDDGDRALILARLAARIATSRR
jgi:hypothetical protein